MHGGFISVQNNIFFQKYKFIKTLGSGGCGKVYLAQNRLLGNYWAIKEISKNRATSISGYIEPEVLKRLNHPALPRICDVYETEDKIYIIEDYIEGVCLKHELDLKGRFEEQKVIEWGIQLCSVLHYLHEQKPDPIIYGDMKPHNVILTKEGFIKLIDFGVSTILNNSFVTDIRTCGVDRGNSLTDKTEEIYKTVFIGTKGYSPPEQYTGTFISPGTDIYSLGITLIQLLSGIDPVKFPNIYYNGEYKEYMSPGLYRILKRCIDINPKHRYQNVAQLMKELKEISLQNSTPHGKGANAVLHQLARIIAFSGVPGSGISTITAAVAEQIVKEGNAVCIADLSSSGALGKSLGLIRTENPEEPKKIHSNLYYMGIGCIHNMDNLAMYSDDHNGQLILHKHFSKLQDQFPYILIDTELSILKRIQRFVNKILLVCDMNPYNISELGDWLKEGILQSVSDTSVIINKFYKGELSSYKLLHGILNAGENEEDLAELITFSKIYEVPYDHRIYIRWMYSGFGEPVKLGSKLSEGFETAVLNISAGIVKTPKPKPRIRLRQLIAGL